MNFYEKALEYREETIAHRRWFHKNAETGLNMPLGQAYVLETLKTLVLTPLDKFIARGEDGRYWIKRSNKDNIKIKCSNYLGKPYDLAFKFDNDKFYCSELVYDIYKNRDKIDADLFFDKLEKIKYICNNNFDYL